MERQFSAQFAATSGGQSGLEGFEECGKIDASTPDILVYAELGASLRVNDCDSFPRLVACITRFPSVFI